MSLVQLTIDIMFRRCQCNTQHGINVAVNDSKDVLIDINGNDDFIATQL